MQNKTIHLPESFILNKFNRKGQFYSIEFIFTIIIFVGLIVILVYFFHNVTNKIDLDKQSSHDYILMERFANSFVLSSGSPVNWEYLDRNDVLSIGLAKNKNELDINKYNMFIDYNSYYDDTVYLLGLGGYNVYVSFTPLGESVPLGEFGILPHDAETVVANTRYAYMNDTKVIVDIKVWK